MWATNVFEATHYATGHVKKVVAENWFDQRYPPYCCVGYEQLICCGEITLCVFSKLVAQPDHFLYSGIWMSLPKYVYKVIFKRIENPGEVNPRQQCANFFQPFMEWQQHLIITKCFCHSPISAINLSDELHLHCKLQRSLVTDSSDWWWAWSKLLSPRILCILNWAKPEPDRIWRSCDRSCVLVFGAF